jgi:hypothetical protein
MAKLPHLLCVPIGRPMHLATMVSYPAVDVAPAVAGLLASGRTLDPGAGDVLPVALAAAVAGCAEARALAWQGLLSFVGLKEGLAGLLAELEGADRAKAYLTRHARLQRLRQRRQAFEGLEGELKRAKAEEFNCYGAVYFPDTEETIATDEIPDYVRDRFRDRTPVAPFGFPVETSEWVGITEGDLRLELQNKGREAFDLNAVIGRSLADFQPDARQDIVDEAKLWRIVGLWLQARSSEAEVEFGMALARWNAIQRVKSVRILRDVIVPTYDPIDRRKALKWCRERAARVDREIKDLVGDWPDRAAG